MFTIILKKIKMIKILHISDTHTFHNQLTIDKDIDLLIHSGDFSNPKDLIQNEREVRNFIDWFSSLNIPNKIAISGNHDTSIQARRVTPGDFAKAGIIYLENNSTTIEGLKIWGSPISPSFGDGWAFNMDRGKIDRVWSTIPEDTDIVVTHGPAKGILDLSVDRDGIMEFCGCTSLRRHILYRVKPKAFLFGHIHNMNNNGATIFNSGTMKLSGYDTIFSNGTIVMDGRFDLGAVNNGNIIELKKEG
jgi:Icc-related predicted phosphoesterase